MIDNENISLKSRKDPEPCECECEGKVELPEPGSLVSANRKDLYLLTGFLGAGKTSLLLYLLDQIPDKKVGIVQNEFGKINIDGDIIRRDGVEMVEISRGSIFCSCLKSNFIQTLSILSTKELDVVFVESSGLSDPSNIEEILSAVGDIAGDAYTFRGTICMVDAVNFPAQIKITETVKRQLAHCNLAVINKVDLVSESELEEVSRQVREINPICQVETSSYGKIPLGFLGQDLTEYTWAETEDSLNSAENRPKTISLLCHEPVKKEEMDAFLEDALPSCYRIKGFFELTDGWYQVDVVEKLRDYKPCEPHAQSELVFLSKVGNQMIRTVSESWKAHVTVPMKLKN